MFDKITVVPGRAESHTHHHSTTVVEKRAPTDESVRLLAEMQQKALDSILARETLQSMGIEVKLYLFQELAGVKSVVLLKVNGKELRSEVKLETWRETPEQRIIKIRDALALCLANHLMQGMLGSIDANTRHALEYTPK